MKARKVFAIAAVVLVLALVHLGLALADENSWSTGGPYGASVMSIAIHPFDNQRIYIGTVRNGIFKTINGGADWSIIHDDTTRNAGGGIRGIKIHPWGPDTMFAVTNAGAFKSVDAGQSWLRVPQFGDCGFFALEVNRGDPPTIFIGTLGSAWRSTDGGESWIEIDLGVSTGSVAVIKADPMNPHIIYLANNATPMDRSIFKSTDYGVTWENIHHNLPRIYEHIYGTSIDVSPLDSQLVYFARANLSGSQDSSCLYRSTDGGEYWLDITPPGLHVPRILDVTASPHDVNTVFICADYGGVLRSTDRGLNWQEINEGLINSQTNTVVIDSVTGFLYLGFFFDGIYRSTDNGETWEKISHNVTSAYCRDMAINWRNPDTLYTTIANSGLYMSTDGAASWEYVDFGPSYPVPWANYVEVDPHDPSYIYLSSYEFSWLPPRGGLYSSTDGGVTWGFFNDGLPTDETFYNVAVADYGGGARRIYLGSSAGLFYSDNLGETWSLCVGGLPPDIHVEIFEISPVTPDLLFVSECIDWFSGNLYKSTDGGQSWEMLSTPGGDYIDEIACDPIDVNVIYVTVAEPQALFKSYDGGQSWNDIDNNLPRPEPPHRFALGGIAINPFNHHNVYVYSTWMGMFVSNNGGGNWVDFNEGLRIGPGGSVTLIDPTNYRRLFSAQKGNSVWEITRTGGGDCAYIPGDCDHNGTPLELGDVIAMIGIYRGSVEPYYVCDCPPHGHTFAAEADPNGNCVAFELGDVVTEIGAYRGTAEASGCEDCPGSRR